MIDQLFCTFCNQEIHIHPKRLCEYCHRTMQICEKCIKLRYCQECRKNFK